MRHTLKTKIRRYRQIASTLDNEARNVENLINIVKARASQKKKSTSKAVSSSGLLELLESLVSKRTIVNKRIGKTFRNA